MAFRGSIPSSLWPSFLISFALGSGLHMEKPATTGITANASDGLEPETTNMTAVPLFSASATKALSIWKSARCLAALFVGHTSQN